VSCQHGSLSFALHTVLLSRTWLVQIEVEHSLGNMIEDGGFNKMTLVSILIIHVRNLKVDLDRQTEMVRWEVCLQQRYFN